GRRRGRSGAWRRVEAGQSDAKGRRVVQVHRNAGKGGVSLALKSKSPEKVSIRGTEIDLGQFLKLSRAVNTGGEGKSLIQQGAVRVNGEIETRRGRRLHEGDVVRLAGRGC